MDFRNIILQSGLVHREAQKYDDEQAARSHAALARQYGARRMAADDSLLDQQTAGTRATLDDQARARGNQEAYRQLAGAGASFDDLANEAQKRGDFGAANEFRTSKANVEREGLKAVVTGALTGVGDQELERIYNGTGKDRVDAGSVKLDKNTGIISYSKDGKPGQLNAGRLAELLGMVKRPEMKQTTVAPGAQLAVDGKIVATNTEGLEAKSGADRKKLGYEYGLKRGLEQFKANHGPEATTALQRNINFMVKNSIAADPAEAFSKLRTAMEKPEEDAILAVAGNLMKGPRYMGKGGWDRAVKDATTMVQTVKGGKSEAPAPAPGQGAPGAAAGGRTYSAGGKTFTEADIESTARIYGITADQVKQRLGIR